MSELVDLSYWNGKVDFVKMREAGTQDVILRASMGATGRDERFIGNAQLAERAGLGVGAYHLWDSRVSPGLQFETFRRQLHMARVWVQYVALDVEEPIQRTTPIMVRMLDWLRWAEVEYRVKPLIYTSYGFWNNWANGGKVAWAQEYPLWVCDPDAYGEPQLPSDWQEWYLWQYSGDGNRLGKHYGTTSTSVDLNRKRVSGNYLTRY